MKYRGNTFLRSLRSWAMLVALGVGISSCSSGGSGLPDLKVETFNFSPTLSGVRINAPLELTMSAPVDPASVTTDSVRIFTTTTTTDQPDPGAPAIGDFVVNGNVIRFLPRIPRNADLSDAGLRIGFRYAVQVPAAPDIVAPVLTTEGDPMVVPFSEEFTTLNQTILPAPGDITAEPNLSVLHQYFIDEGIENGSDPCDRATLPSEDRDSPQVIFTDPAEGESGFGRITGIQAGLGTAFVRLDPITVLFSEPVAPWRVRPEDIQIRNTNLGGETFDLQLFFQQDRNQSRLQATVFDADSAFDQASVPQGRYELRFTNFCDLSGNLLVNSSTCEADGTFQLSFSTVSSPTVPTDIKLTFDDDDGEGHVDVGGLPTGTNNPNEFPNHLPPFLSGMATDTVDFPSVSNQTSSANWGDIAMWTGREVMWDNGFNLDFDPITGDRPVPASMRLRGSSVGASTAILAPIAGRGNGPSDPVNGSSAGSVPVDTNQPGEDPLDQGKVDFVVIGSGVTRLDTGSALTGPIVYHYRRFTFESDGTARPVLTATSGSVYPLMIFVEDDITIVDAIIQLDGQNGEFGFNGNNDGSGSALSRMPGGAGGSPGAAGGFGGNGGAFTAGPDVSLLNGDIGGVPINVFGAIDSLNFASAGLAGMAPGGGGQWDSNGDSDENPPTAVFQGGGGAGLGSDGLAGADNNGDGNSPGGQGVGGKKYGDSVNFPYLADPDILGCGGAGGGGGGAEDDGGPAGSESDPNGESDVTDDGGGGGGGAGGFLGLYAGGNINLGEVTDPEDHTTFLFATLRCVGGRGGSTYANLALDAATGNPLNPPVPGDAAGNPDLQGPIGQGEGGGGGGGGAICVIAGGQVQIEAAEMYPHGKRGGNHPAFEAGGRGPLNLAGDGGGGALVVMDSDGLPVSDWPAQIGGDNTGFLIIADSLRDIDNDGEADLDPVLDADEILDLDEMSGLFGLSFDVWGDDPRERLWGTSQIVTEFFDTLSDSTSYDGVRVLSNAPRFPYDTDMDNSTNRTIRVWVDTTRSNAGFPDLTGNTEQADGRLSPPAGFSEEIPLHRDMNTGDELALPQHESRYIIDTASGLQFNRFVRVRIIYDLSLIGTKNELLGSFAPPSAGDLPIADDPNTPEPENTLGNTDTAPEGVPAVAELRVTFTVGG
ncbi:MAG: hypothetical protein ACYTHK_07620 [Planctomycetota bacterium]|jgi:hypothetical protein